MDYLKLHIEDLTGISLDVITAGLAALEGDIRTARAEREQEHANGDECAALPRHGVRLTCHLHHPSM